MGDNYECTQESSILPMPRSQSRAINLLNRTSQIQFSIKQSLPAKEYFSAILVVMLANIGFCLLFIIIIAIFYCCRRSKMDEMDSDEIDGNFSFFYHKRYISYMLKINKKLVLGIQPTILLFVRAKMKL